MTFGSRWNWLVLIALTIAGALVRVWFVMRHRGPAPVWLWACTLAIVLALAALLAPRAQTGAATASFAQVSEVIQTRCVACHSEKPAFQGLAEAPKGVRLDTPERIRVQAPQIYQQTVLR